MMHAAASTSAPRSRRHRMVSRIESPVVTMSSTMTTRAPFSTSKRRSLNSPPSRSTQIAGTPRWREVS